jgi:hypothetical protein
MKKMAAVATATILLLAGCKETGDTGLGTVQEVHNTKAGGELTAECRIRVAPVSGKRGSYGKWFTVPAAECENWHVGDTYPKENS